MIRHVRLHGTRIKFCGITNANDAQAAVASGVDAIGVVFAPGRTRTVSLDLSREIVAVVPPFITVVGLFVDQPPGHILETCRAVSIGTVQLHGDETVDVLNQLPGLRVIKAVRTDRPDKNWLALRRSTRFAGLLLDAPGPGGTGVENDWAAVASLGVPSDAMVTIAGGLTPENVGGVIQAFRPAGVDVSSGIEQNRGIKSVDKMRAFIRAVRAADQIGLTGDGSGIP